MILLALNQCCRSTLLINYPERVWERVRIGIGLKHQESFIYYREYVLHLSSRSSLRIRANDLPQLIQWFSKLAFLNQLTKLYSQPVLQNWRSFVVHFREGSFG